MTVAPVSTSASTPASSGAGPDRLDREIDRFEATGEVSQGLVEEAQAAGGEAFAQRLDRLPPARRGAREGALADKGLLGLVGDTAGSLVGGTVDTAVGVVDVAADGAVETRSERQVEDALGQFGLRPTMGQRHGDRRSARPHVFRLLTNRRDALHDVDGCVSTFSRALFWS